MKKNSMNRCPQGDFYVVATWHPTDPYRYCQYNIPADSYLETMALAERIYKDGLEGLGRPDSISVEKINNN